MEKLNAMEAIKRSAIILYPIPTFLRSLSSEKGRKCKNENCRECEVYLLTGRDFDMKALFRAIS
jgi:hypothetical protein